jgi:glycosyltransferase involved in cell wall biosynthesis
MRDSWLVVVPSIRPDPFPNVVLEAMAEGRAVIGSDIGGIPEMVVDGVTGSLVPPGDRDSLAHSMARLLSDRSLAEGMGARGHRRAREEFSVEPFTAAWRATLGASLGSRR